MYEQGRLAFFTDLPRRPRKPERMFFGVMPEPSTARRIDALRRRLCGQGELQGSAVGRDRLHVSLHLVGDFKRLKTSDVYKAQLAASEVSVAPFEVVFDSVETFRPAPGREHKRPTVLRGGSAELTDLHAALGTALRRQNLRAGLGFKAHITLCYGAKAVSQQPVEPIRFRVDNFVLIHSERGLGRYNILGRWALTG